MTAPATALCAALALAVLALAGCTGAGRQDGPLYAQGSTMVPGTYYGELFDAERKRWYLFLDPATATAFKDGAREMPLSRTLIGAGPERATVQVEQVKDAEASRTIGSRLVATFNARHGTSAKF